MQPGQKMLEVGLRHRPLFGGAGPGGNRSPVRFPAQVRKRIASPKRQGRMDLGKIVSEPLGHPPQRTETNRAVNRAVANLAVSRHGQPWPGLSVFDKLVNGYPLLASPSGLLLDDGAATEHLDLDCWRL